LARHAADLESLIGVGACAARRCDRAEATRVAELLAHWSQQFPLGRNTYGLACITAVLGDSTRAIALLEQSFREGYPVVSIWERHAHRQADFLLEGLAVDRLDQLGRGEVNADGARSICRRCPSVGATARRT